MIFCKKEHAKAIDKAVFPGLQGGPHNHTTAAIAVALKEALDRVQDLRQRRSSTTRRRWPTQLTTRGFDLITGGTDNHLILIDLDQQGVTRQAGGQGAGPGGIVANYNAVPFDPRKPFDPSGLRIGTPAVTSRGMWSEDMDTRRGLDRAGSRGRTLG